MYALCVHALGVDYQLSSVLAWLVAVLNNFVLNRHWTFDAAAGSARLQGMRFFLVSLVAEGFSLGLLTIFVEGAGIEKVAAQALAVAAVDAAELPRQQALELSRAGVSERRSTGGAGPRDPVDLAAERRSQPQRVPIL